MSGHDAFERILTSLHEAMLDDVHWPTTTALIDEACGLTSNGIVKLTKSTSINPQDTAP